MCGIIQSIKVAKKMEYLNPKLKKHIKKRLENSRPLTGCEVDAVVYYEFQDHAASCWSRRNNFLDSGQSKKRFLMREYNLTMERYHEMWREQEGLCVICGEPIDGTNCHVDHDHKTGHIRGLLCGNCNKGLGMFKDNPESLKEAVKYLQGFGGLQK